MREQIVMKRLLVLLAVLALAPILGRSLNPSLNDDVLGLIVFKADIQDPKAKLGSWNEDDDSPCGWVGVKCNPRSNAVVELNLDGFSLSGHIGRGLLQLQSLRKLSLSKNNLTGTLSPKIAHIDNLRVLDLSGNGFSGAVPEEFFRQCGSLRVVSLANNKFSGEIPESLGSCAGLATIDLSLNRFSGSVPAGIWSLNGIRSLDLSGNALEGEIPEDIEGLKNLRAINLGKNRFTGLVPDGIGSCLLLRSVDLSENGFTGNLPQTMQKLGLCGSLNVQKNSFSGEVPEWIGEMKSLQTLDLSSNRFSGQVPSSLSNLEALKVLNFSANGFTGSLPKSLVYCTNLLAMDFSKNSLEGDLPEWIFKAGLKEVLVSEKKPSGNSPSSSPTGSALQKLEVLDLSGNGFSGEITSAIGALSSLHVLNLSDNALVGPVPATIGELKALDSLDMSGNQLNGSIPLEIGGAFSLKELRLEKNFLTGKIPTSIENCSSLTTLIVSQNRLSGPIPAAVGKLSNLQYVDLSFNNLSGALPKQLANLPNIFSFNISHNNLQGELPLGGFFNTISPYSVWANPSLCGAAVNKSCPAVLPKPIVLNPNSSSDSSTGALPTKFGHKRIILSISALIAIGAAAFIVIGVIAITVLNLRVRTSTSRPPAAITFSGGDDFSNSPTTDANSGKLVMFSGDPDFSTGAHALLNKDCELGRGDFSISALIAIGAAAFIVIGVIAITVLNLRVRTSTSRPPAAITFSGGDDFSNSPTTDANSGKLVMFSGDPDFSTGAHALLNKDCELGRGGFGAVYRTVLRDGRSVAIKKLTVSSLVKSQEEFEREVKKLGKVRHDNLVEIEGYYWTPSLQLIIYEYVSGGTLYKHLHDGAGGNFLSWNDRFNIILGTAKSLAHLHQMNIIHYNIKSSNVLISSSGEPKVGDFGLARLLPMLDRYVLSSKIQSALGYMAPEFACKTVKITEKCDVYGFGVLVLEVVTGKRPVEYMEDDVVVLCDMVRGALEEGRVEECIDARLQGSFPAEEAIPVMKLGLICTSQVPSNRPDMGEVVNILELIRCPSEGQDESG